MEPTRFWHFRLQGPDGRPAPKGGVTVARVPALALTVHDFERRRKHGAPPVKTAEGEYVWWAAVCSLKDTYSRLRGRQVAEGRARHRGDPCFRIFPAPLDRQLEAFAALAAMDVYGVFPGFYQEQEAAPSA